MANGFTNDDFNADGQVSGDSASFTNAASAGQLNADNLRLDGNTLSSTNTNGVINIQPDGTGTVEVNKTINSSVTSETGLLIDRSDSGAHLEFLRASTKLGGLEVDTSGPYFQGEAGVSPLRIMSDNGLSFSCSSNGYLTYDDQPAFLARLSSTQNDVTGDGTVYTIVFDSEVADRNGVYDNTTGTFTAPIAGLYIFTTQVRFTGITASHTQVDLDLVTSNRNYKIIANCFNMSTSATLGYTMTTIADMDASDTATITLNVSGGTKVIDVTGDATNARTSFGGWLLG